MTTKTKIKKWGNSLAIRLPKTGLEMLNLKENSEVSFGFDKNQIIIKPEKNEKEYSLNKLVSKINSKNIHKETDWGKSVGKEIW